MMAAVLALGAVTVGAVLVLRYAPWANRSDRWNLLLITLDTTRADRLGCYGYAKARTPALDELAKRGARFDAAYTCSPTTLPSHSTIHTGTYPTFHRIRTNGTHSLHDSAVTLAERCRDAGYATGASVGAYVLHSQFGLGQGFQKYHEQFASNARSAAAVTDDAITFVQAQSADEPFFLWAHYFDPHTPYDAPADFAAAFPTDPYDAEVAYMDSQIARLIEELRSRDVLDRTLVVVVADHGEGLGQHEPAHQVFLYEPTMRVPLIFAAPDLVPLGKVVADVVATVDIFPTVCELLDLPASPVQHGVSVVPWMRAEPDGEPALVRAALLDTYAPQQMYGWSELWGLRTGKWKYIRAPRSELYDIAADPAEANNLIDHHPEVAQGLDRQLTALIERTSQGGVESRVELSDAGQASIARLGYVQPGDSAATGPAVIDPKDRIEQLFLHNVAGDLMDRDKNAAVAKYQELLQKYPEDVKARSVLASLYAEMGRLDDAIAGVEAVVRARPQNVASLRMLGFLYLQKGRLPDALRAVDAALAINPRSNQSHLIRSIILGSQNRLDEALASIESSLQLDPTFNSALLQKGELLMKLGRLNDAIAPLSSISPDNPNRYDAVLILHDVYAKLGRREDAQRIAQEITDMRAKGHVSPRKLIFMGGGY